MNPVLELKSIDKSFAGTPALSSADFSLARAEIHALLGENGAGKSTLMNIASGVYRPDGGRIFIKGEKVRPADPLAARGYGIGMVHQNFRLSLRHSVLENIMLGHRDLPFLLDRRRLADKVSGIARRYGLPIDPRAGVWQLSVGERQRVEIVKTLVHDADILILDEPTAVLTPSETDKLFNTLKLLKDAGKSIVFISHKLEEVLRLSDRVSIMRSGKTTATIETAQASAGELARLMVGRSVDLARRSRGESNEPRRAVISLSGINARNDRGVPVLVDLSLDIMAGEILGVAGVSGNGQLELAEIIYGLRSPESGSLLVEGIDALPMSPARAIASGIAYIPADRRSTGTAPGLSITENLMLKDYREPEFSPWGFLDHGKMNEKARKLVADFDIRCASAGQAAGLLSGGNLQKLIISRELSRAPTAILAVYPSRGLDVGSIETVRRHLVEARDRGAAILLVSEDLDEIFALADRIAVMCSGRLAGPFTVDETDRVRVGMLMAGSHREGKYPETPTS